MEVFSQSVLKALVIGVDSRDHFLIFTMLDGLCCEEFCNLLAI